MNGEDVVTSLHFGGGKEMLRIAKDGFFVRGVKVEQGPGESQEVYAAFIAWMQAVGSYPREKGDGAFVTRLPIRVNALVNQRNHWRQKARIARAERQLVKARVFADMPIELTNAIRFTRAKIRVTLTRIGKRLLDDDNLQGAFKHVRDGVADAVGIDDGSPRYKWVYVQEKGSAYGVEIQIQIESGKPKGRSKTCGS